MMDTNTIKTPSLVIENIKFNNGLSIQLNRDDIVLLVGANNVGKSRTLKDLKDDLIDASTSKIMIEEVAYKTFDFSSENIKAYFEKHYCKDNTGDYIVYYDVNDSQCFDSSVLTYNPENRELYKAFYSFLSTENRLNITKPIRFNSDVDNRSLNIMSVVENSSDAINSINEVLKAGFGKAIETYEEHADWTVVKKYKIGKFEEINDAIQSNSRENRIKLRTMEDLHNQGDGIRSAVAILLSLIVNDNSLFLIDEPESFLHPPQARALGKNIVELSKNKQCFISTHNIDFIKGVLEADPSRVKIIKINRTENDNEFNLVDNNSIVKIANDKNLKYTNILDGLFYNQLVLCENESDCKFYSAVLEHLDLSVYQNTLFCAVGGKHHFKKVVPLLKKLDINYAVIADIDLINGRDVMEQLLNTIEDGCYERIKSQHKEFINEFEKGVDSQVKTQEQIKTEIIKKFNSDKYMPESIANEIKALLKNISKFKLLKSGGKAILPTGECVSLFKEIKNFLIDKKIFILECGEIERFVPEIKAHGAQWVEKTFEKYKDMNDDVYEEARRFVKTVFNIVE